MSLIYGYSDATRSKNIGKLRREGYGPKQAAAIAYKIQRQELKRYGMSTRRLASASAHHRRRSRAHNPIGDGISKALPWLGGGAVVGAGLGIIGNTANPGPGALGGAASGVGLVGVGGFIAGLVDPKIRDAGFSAAAIGLGGLVLLSVAANLIP